MRRFLCLLLVMSFVLSLGVRAEAAEEGSFTYEIVVGKLTVTAYNGPGGDVSVPATLGSSAVHNLGEGLFLGRSDITSVSLPDCLESIGRSVFSDCKGLVSVSLGNGVSSIGEYAFIGCSALTSIVLPDSLTSLGASAFYDCTALEHVSFGKGLSSIASSTFGNCVMLQSATLPSGLRSIGDHAFVGCTRLSALSFPDALSSIGAYAFMDCPKLTELYIPKGISTIGKAAFFNDVGLEFILFEGSPPFTAGSEIFHYRDEVQLNAPMDIVVRYLPDYAGKWASQGASTWMGYPIAVYEAAYKIEFFVDGVCEFSYSIERGRSLENVPDVPHKQDCLAEWDRNDFKAVTQDIVVNAIYRKLYIDKEKLVVYNIPIGTSYSELSEAFGQRVSGSFSDAVTGSRLVMNRVNYTAAVVGDIDGDGTISAADAALILRALVELETLAAHQACAADLGLVGYYSAASAAEILRFLVELETTLGKLEK